MSDLSPCWMCWGVYLFSILFRQESAASKLACEVVDVKSLHGHEVPRKNSSQVSLWWWSPLPWVSARRVTKSFCVSMFFQNSESNRSRLGINRIIDGFFTVVEPSVCFSGLGRRLIFCQIFLTSVGYVLGSFVMNTFSLKQNRGNERETTKEPKVEQKF